MVGLSRLEPGVRGGVAGDMVVSRKSRCCSRVVFKVGVEGVVCFSREHGVGHVAVQMQSSFGTEVGVVGDPIGIRPVWLVPDVVLARVKAAIM